MAIDYEGQAKEAAGNWQKFDSFVWWGENNREDPENWCITYTHNRDSPLVTQANGKAISAEMQPFLETEEPDIEFMGASHWACGWIEGFAIRVYKPDGSITEPFKKMCDLNAALADYPVLDDELLSQMEYDSALLGIESQGSRFTADDAPDDWKEQMFTWLWANDQPELEDCDGQGAFPSEEACRRGLEALGMLDPEYAETSDSGV